MTADLTELRKLAEAAVVVAGGSWVPACDLRESLEDEVAEFIAAANPATVLDLLDQLDKATEHRDSLAAALIEVQREKLALLSRIEAVRASYEWACHDAIEIPDQTGEWVDALLADLGTAPRGEA